MRLAQLARKLEVRQADIAAFLEANNVHVEKGSNVRLDEPTVALVLGEFGKNADTGDAIAHPVPEPDGNATQQPSPGDIAGAANENTELPAEHFEVIRPVKVELPGLRVVGRIDLPEPKPRVRADESADVEKTAGKAPDRRNKRRTERAGGNRKNPVTLRRERDAREEEKRRAELEIEKEKRRQKYLNKVTISVPTKPARLYDDDLEELQQDAPQEATTGLWRTFLRWLYRK